MVLMSPIRIYVFVFYYELFWWIEFLFMVMHLRFVVPPFYSASLSSQYFSIFLYHRSI